METQSRPTLDATQSTALTFQPYITVSDPITSGTVLTFTLSFLIPHTKAYNSPTTGVEVTTHDTTKKTQTTSVTFTFTNTGRDTTVEYAPYDTEISIDTALYDIAILNITVNGGGTVGTTVLQYEDDEGGPDTIGQWAHVHNG
jgi:hypothetical protein